jgi:hypothetical protein
MLVSYSKPAILDTGFIYALFDKRDPYYEDAVTKNELMENLPVIIPWPCLYETLNTQFVKNTIQIRQFELFLKRPKVILQDDCKYRENAKELTIEQGAPRFRTISLVDMVIRLMLDDQSLHNGYLFTFNPKDFVDICRSKKIVLPCQEK